MPAIPAIIVAGASIGSALLSRHAANSAANTQADAATQASADQLTASREANALQAAMYLLQRGDLAPARNVGTGALYMLRDLLGIRPQSSTSYTVPAPGTTGSGSTTAGSGGTTTNPLGTTTTADGKTIFTPNPDILTADQQLEDSIGQVVTGNPQTEGTDIVYPSSENYNAYDFPITLSSDTTGVPVESGLPSDMFGSLLKGFEYGPDQFKADPGYDFAMKEGQKALERSASARGGLLGGGALKELTRYAEGTAAQQYDNAYNRAFNTFNANQTNLYNRLASMAGIGQMATTQLGQAGTNYANQAGSNITSAADRSGGYLTDAANARASGYIGAANSLNQALGNAANAGVNAYYFNRLYG